MDLDGEEGKDRPEESAVVAAKLVRVFCNEGHIPFLDEEEVLQQNISKKENIHQGRRREWLVCVRLYLAVGLRRKSKALS